MKLVSQIDIDRPIDVAKRLMADPANSKKWMADLEAYEPLSGKPGQPGSTARMTFRSGRSTMAFVVTAKASDAADTLRSTLEGPNMTIETVGRFETLGSAKTRYTFEQDFIFKGPAKLFGFIMRGAIKKQQEQHMQGFKRFAESA